MANLFSKGTDLSEPPQRPYGPTHYQSRSTKLRLFGLVAALVLVLTVAERARDPKSWAWFETLSKPQIIDPTGVETLLRKAQPARSETEHTFVIKGAESKDTPSNTDDEESSLVQDSATRAWKLGWKEIFQSLDFEQKNLLYDLVGSGFGRSELSAEDRPAAELLLQTLTERWESYTNRAFQSLAAIDDTDKSQWVEVLRSVNIRQKDELAPILSALVNQTRLEEMQKKALADYQQILDSITLEKVADDTVLRPAENQIYFRLIADPLPVKSTDTNSITFLQLLKQPEDYRGKPITIRGRVKGVSRAIASKNRVGVKEIYSYWLMLEDGPTSPLLICSTKPPEGFPAFQLEEGKSEQRLQEDIVLQGYFFKRFAYQAKDGTRTVPLILATQATWLPTSSRTEQIEEKPLDVGFIFPAMLGISLLAILSIYLIGFRRLRPVPKAPSPELLLELEKFPIPVTTHESLRQLEEAETGSPYPSTPIDS